MLNQLEERLSNKRVILKVLKVHLSDHPEFYGRAPVDVTGDKVNKNLLLDTSLQHLYITTDKKVRAAHTTTFKKNNISITGYKSAD